MLNLPKYPFHQNVEGAGAGSIPTNYEPRSKETENAEVPYKHWGVKNADSEPLVNGQQLEKTSETKSLMEMTAQQTEAQPTSSLRAEEPNAHSIATQERKLADLLKQADELIRANSEKKLVNLSCDKLNESLLKGPENVLETLQNMELPKGLKVKITLKSQPDNPISLIPPGDNLKDQKDLPKLMNTAIRILKQHDQTKLGDIDSALTEKKLNAINKELVSTDDIIEGRDTGGTGKGAQGFARLQEQTKRCEISVNQPDHVEVKHPDAIPVTQLLQSAHPQLPPQQSEGSGTNISSQSSQDQSKGSIREKDSLTESPDINPNETVKAHDAVTPDVKADITEAASPGNTLNPDPVLNTDSLPPPPDWLMASDPAEEEKIELPTNTGQTKQTSSVQAAKDLDTSLDDISVSVENDGGHFSTDTEQSVVAPSENTQKNDTPLEQATNQTAILNDLSPDAPPPPPIPKEWLQQAASSQGQADKKENVSSSGISTKQSATNVESTPKTESPSMDEQTSSKRPFETELFMKVANKQKRKSPDSAEIDASLAKKKKTQTDNLSSLHSELSDSVKEKEKRGGPDSTEIDAKIAAEKDNTAKNISPLHSELLDTVKEKATRKRLNSNEIDENLAADRAKKAKETKEKSQDSKPRSIQEALMLELNKRDKAIHGDDEQEINDDQEIDNTEWDD